MLFNNSLRRGSQVFVCTFLTTNMSIKSQRGAYISRRLRGEQKILKNINCAAFVLVTWFRIASFVVELILYTLIWDGWRVSFFADWIRYNHVINKSSCDWNKFSLITEAAIFLTRKHLKYASLYAKIHQIKFYYVLNNNMYIHMYTLYTG